MRKLSLLSLLALSSIAGAQQLPAPSADTSEWRMTGVTGTMMDATYGPGQLEEAGGIIANGTDQLTTCSAAGVPLINGVDAEVLQFGIHTPTEGYRFRPRMTSGVGDGPRQWTMIFDMYISSLNPLMYMGIWQGSDGNVNDAELFLSPVNLGFYVAGSADVCGFCWNTDTWTRFVMVNDYPSTSSLFVNGAEVWSGISPDYLWNGDDGGPANWFLADNDNETGPGWLANLAITDQIMSATDIATLGAPDAAGVFTPFTPPAIGTTFCLGDGTATSCPCGNASDTTGGDAGCANGASTAGGAMMASGSSSLLAADLILSSTGLVPSQPGLYFQGNNAIADGAGVAFGDGLRCAGGGVIRLQVSFADSSGASATSIDIGAKGSVSVGDTKRYQVWYRDPSTSPCGAQFNLSNGFEITWGA
jgi:hypothetical protein